MGELERLAAERDLYRRVCLLAAVEEPRTFLARTMGLLVDATGARRGYLELRDGQSVWSFAHRMDDVDSVKAELSSGILMRALERGQFVESGRAEKDPDLQGYRSVRNNRIQAVLCGPIGEPAFGALYLQDSASGGPFGEEVRRLVQDLVRVLEPTAQRLIHERGTAADPTAIWRDKLVGSEVLVGRSPALAEILEQLSMVARNDIPVVVTGPAGSGKTTAMRVVHDSSPRRRHRFVSLNCAALTAELALAKLFGTMRGGFTGAIDQAGAVELADGGTLFLDEVAELDPAVQAMLLKFLDDGEYQRVGEQRTRRADVRVLAATNADLEARIGEGTWRKDLHSRLCWFPIRMPGLAERRQDIGAIAAAALEGLREIPEPMSLSPGAVRSLETHDWDGGTVRSLLAAVHRGAVRAAHAGSPVVTAAHLFPEASVGVSEPMTWHEQTKAFQVALLHRTLDECDGSVKEAARRLDVDPSYLYRLLRRDRDEA